MESFISQNQKIKIKIEAEIEKTKRKKYVSIYSYKNFLKKNHKIGTQVYKIQNLRII